MTDPTRGLLDAMTPNDTTLLGQFAAARAELATTRDALAALVFRLGGDVTLTTYELQSSPTGRDLEFLYMPDSNDYRLRIKAPR